MPVVTERLHPFDAAKAAGREPFAESYHYASLTTDFEELTGVPEGEGTEPKAEGDDPAAPPPTPAPAPAPTPEPKQ